jgi:LemA protein
MGIGLVILVIVVIIGGLLVSLYNKLAKQKVLIEEAESDIDTFLKQRYDMIPNLVEIVKGYAKHEKDTFEKVTEMRSKAMSAGSLEEKMKYEKELSGAITNLMAVAENYPELKANENFKELQTSLKELENSIQKSRRFYNGTVRDFNAMLAVFPNNLIAGIFGFKEMPFFEASEEEKENVKIKF